MSFDPSEQAPLWFPATRKFLAWGATEVTGVCELIGLATLNAREVLVFLLQGRLTWRHYVEQAAFIGIDALGTALLLTLFSGMVIALQLAQEMTRQGAGDFVGALVAMSILRELAPVMTAFAVIAMVGSAYSAELATMKIQKQIDALRMLHVDPIRYLVLPRILAGISMLPLMTILTAMAGIVGGMVVSYFIADLNYNTYLESVWQQTKASDLFGAMIKSGVFGFLIVLLSTTIGLRTQGGSKEVGVSTTNAVVWSFIAMALADYVLSMLLFGKAG